MPGTVLVVEDNPITRKVVQLALGGEGFAVVMAENARAALEALDRCSPDLVLQDIALGDGAMDGFALAAALRRKAGPDTPILAFTGYADEQRLRAAGFCDVLMKPIEPSKLVSAVHAHLVARTQDLPVLPRTVTAPIGSGSAARTARAWTACSAMLTQLTTLTGSRVAPAEIVAQVLASFLHASGISAGLAFTYEGGALVERTHIGLPAHAAAELVTRWRKHPRVLECLASGVPQMVSRSTAMFELFAGTDISSMMIIPLADANGCEGLLCLASLNTELAREWLEIGAVMAGMVTQAIRLAAMVSRLAASEHKFRGIAESTADGIIVTNMRGDITYANTCAEQLVAIPQTQLLGRRVGTVLTHLATGAHQGQLARGDASIPIETTARCFEDPPGELSWVYVVRDLTERNRLVELADSVNRDVLTGMYNRRRFSEVLARRMASARRYHTGGALLLIDVDEFKQINDGFGHAAGDQALREVAQVLIRNTRESDLAARLGGDEFAVLLDHATLEGAELCATKLLELFARIDLTCAGGRGISASIGIADLGGPDATPESVLANADRALYQAKHDGRGCARTARRD